MTTLQEIGIGFVLAIVPAIPLGLLLALSETAKRALYPAVVFVQLIPKIAVAPLFLVWFGFGIQSKVFLVVLLTYFPLLIASITGFSILDDRQLYLTRSMGASSWQTFRYLRLPSALPVIFAGLKTSATIAATAAIVAEFVGANKGLGYMLLEGDLHARHRDHLRHHLRAHDHRSRPQLPRRVRRVLHYALDAQGQRASKQENRLGKREHPTPRPAGTSGRRFRRQETEERHVGRKRTLTLGVEPRHGDGGGDGYRGPGRGPGRAARAGHLPAQLGPWRVPRRIRHGP